MKMKFLIVIERTKGGFLAYSPDMQGCVATGATRKKIEIEERVARPEAPGAVEVLEPAQPTGFRGSEVGRKLVHGTEEDLARALEASCASSTINTAFVERHNGTDRTYNARKRRRTYELSKDLAVHVAVRWWVVFCYNFHHLHRGLVQRLSDGSYLHRIPAMVMGLAEKPLTVAEIISTQVVGFRPMLPAAPAAFLRRHASGPAP